MRSLFFGKSTTAPSNSVANFNTPTGINLTPTNVESTRNRCTFPCSTTVSQLYVKLDTAPGGSASYTFKIRKNGADTGVTLTITGAATSGTDTSHSVTFAAGDVITISSTPASTPTAPTNVYWNFVVDTGSNSFTPIIGSIDTSTGLSNTIPSYIEFMGSTSSGTAWSATEAPVQMVAPCAGTLDNFYVSFGTAPGGSASYTLAIVQNGTPSTLTTTVSAASTTGADTTHSIAVAAGDSISISATPASTPTVSIMGWGLRFTPTVTGQSFFCMDSRNSPSNSATQYESPATIGGGGWNATETARQVIIGDCTLQAFYVTIGTAPALTKSRTFVVRNNAGATALTSTISGTSTAGNITGQSVAIAQGDLVSLEAQQSGTPTVIVNGVHTGVLIYMSPVVPSRGFLGMGIFI